jgi:hypothetical protein
MNNDAILRLYRQGMVEARRILRRGGLLWLKCKDEIESDIQHWSHIQIYLAGLELGFYAKDLFILVPDAQSEGNWNTQLHARKRHSYLWLFQKPLRVSRCPVERRGSGYTG